MKFSIEQKMQAISDHLYNQDGRPAWEPYVDAYYTIIRNDTELFQIVQLDDDKLGFLRVDDDYLEDCERFGYDNVVQVWDVDGFTTESFGPNRIPVPEYILGIERSENAPKRPWD